MFLYLRIRHEFAFYVNIAVFVATTLPRINLSISISTLHLAVDSHIVDYTIITQAIKIGMCTVRSCTDGSKADHKNVRPLSACRNAC